MLDMITSIHDPYMCNIAAIILVCVLFAANYRKVNGDRMGYKALMHMISNICLYAVVEILSYLLDGMPGTGMTVLLYVLNSLLFYINMVLGFGWVLFTAHHLGYEIPKKTMWSLTGCVFFGMIVLIVNLFWPIVFDIQDNVYVDFGPLYFIFWVIAAIFYIYTINVYRICRRNGGVLKYFPVWMYIIPSVVGIVLEVLIGSSIMCLCNAIAMTAVLISMQKEEVFKDRLTGLYNRAYLEEIKIKLEKDSNSFVSGIMLDLNGFKGINDNYGHAEGDLALENAAEIIREGVGTFGDAIRYAGDEFIVILNTCDEAVITACVERIQKKFEDYNSKSTKPYRLSASIGYASFNAGTQTVNEFLNMIDRNMYDNKKLYYQESSQQ